MVHTEAVRFVDQEMSEGSGLISTEKSDLEELDDVKVSHEQFIQQNDSTDAEGESKENKALNSEYENPIDNKKHQSGAQVNGIRVGSNHFIKAAQQMSQTAGKSYPFSTKYDF
jgi:hypothetical protein